MTYASKIVLHLVSAPTPDLDELVEAFLRSGVELVAVAGVDCELIHDTIDGIVVGDGSDPSRFLNTTWHTDESLEDVVEFANAFRGKKGGAVQVVEI